MKPVSAPSDTTNPTEQRRAQILDAAMSCFARRGFRHSTMQDISAEAGISVGLIYRYFENKEAVISAMAAEHLAEIERKVEAARLLPRLLDQLQTVLWCDAHEPRLAASFVVDLFAESAHNAHVRGLVASVHDRVIAVVTDLIAASPEAAALAPGVDARKAAETVFHGLHGLLLDEVLRNPDRSPEALLAERAGLLRRLWALLFPTLSA